MLPILTVTAFMRGCGDMATPGELPLLLVRFGCVFVNRAPSAARAPYSTAPSMPAQLGSDSLHGAVQALAEFLGVVDHQAASSARIRRTWPCPTRWKTAASGAWLAGLQANWPSLKAVRARRAARSGTGWGGVGSRAW